MITKQMLKVIEADLAEALKTVGDKHKVTIRFAGGKYESMEATMKLKITDDEKNSDANLKSEWDLYCRRYGFETTDFNKVVKDGQGNEYKLVGFNVTKPKNCIKLLRLRDNTEMQCGKETAKSMLKRAEA